MAPTVCQLDDICLTDPASELLRTPSEGSSAQELLMFF